MFLLYTSELLSIQENKLIGYADDFTLIAVVRQSYKRQSYRAESLIRGLGRVVSGVTLGDEIKCE